MLLPTHLQLVRLALRLTALLMLPLCTQADSGSSEQQPIQIGMITSGPPWNNQSTEPTSGIGIEILTVIFHKLDTPIEITLLPPSRLIAQLHNGSLHAASVTDDGSAKLPATLACSGNLINVPFGLYVRSDEALASTFKTPKQDIAWQQLQAGVLRFNHIGSMYLKKAGNLHTFANSAQLFRSLKASRINAVNSSPLVVKHWQKTLNLKLAPLLHLNHLSNRLCFSRKLLGSQADYLANQLDKTFFDLLDNKPNSFSTEALHAARLFDARKPPKTVLEVE
jgi:hypothetical protein